MCRLLAKSHAVTCTPAFGKSTWHVLQNVDSLSLVLDRSHCLFVQGGGPNYNYSKQRNLKCLPHLGVCHTGWDSMLKPNADNLMHRLQDRASMQCSTRQHLRHQYNVPDVSTIMLKATEPL